MDKCPRCGYVSVPCFYCDDEAILEGAVRQIDPLTLTPTGLVMFEIPVCTTHVPNLIGYQNLSKEERAALWKELGESASQIGLKFLRGEEA